MSNEKNIREPLKKSGGSLHGLTKGTELEPMIAALAQGEAVGVMMYYALARLATEQGLDDAAKIFIEAANQEAVHAGFYATLNGRYPQNFWAMVAGVAKAETKGEASIKALAGKVRAAGFDAAADEMEIFAKQEGHHGVTLQELLEKYAPKTEPPAQKTFVCKVCGYEHVGDTPPEKCPLCGQPASAFTEKSPAQKIFVCGVCGYEHVGDAPPEKCPLCGQPASAFTEKSGA